MGEFRRDGMVGGVLHRAEDAVRCLRDFLRWIMRSKRLCLLEFFY